MNFKPSLRDYKISIASNLLGYISEVNENEINDQSYYNIGELIGRQGIEKSYVIFFGQVLNVMFSN